MKPQSLLVEVRTFGLSEEAQSNAALKFADNLGHELTQAGLLAELGKTVTVWTTWATCNRVAVLIPEVLSAAPDRTFRKRGPAKADAYDEDGNATLAMTKFLEGLGDSLVADVSTINYKGKEYVEVVAQLPGPTLEKIIGRAIESAVEYTGHGFSNRVGGTLWPVSNVTIIHGFTPIETRVFGMDTEPHSMTKDGTEIELDSAWAYPKALRDAGIILDKEDRAKKIKELAEAESGLAILDSRVIMDNVMTTESPVAHKIAFNKTYLSMPQFLLKKCVAKHLQAFLVGNDSELENEIIYFSDGKIDDKALEEISSALTGRLEELQDAYEEDMKLSVEDAVEGCKQVSYFSRAGNLNDYMFRLDAIAHRIALTMDLSSSDRDTATSAAVNLVIDSRSRLCQDYPEFQGKIASLMLKNYPQEVRDIVANYKNTLRDGCDSSIARDVLVLAVELEYLLCVFYTHGLPTGTQDRYGLRRVSKRIISVLKKYPKVSVDALLDQAQIALAEDQSFQPIILKPEQDITDIKGYIARRIVNEARAEQSTSIPSHIVDKFVEMCLNGRLHIQEAFKNINALQEQA